MEEIDFPVCKSQDGLGSKVKSGISECPKTVTHQQHLRCVRSELIAERLLVQRSPVPVASASILKQFDNLLQLRRRRYLTVTFSLCVQAVLQKLGAQPSPSPLYAAVLMKDAITWRSSYNVIAADLPNTTEAAFSVLLDSMEMHLGYVFVSHTLAYITVALNGLSEVCFK